MAPTLHLLCAGAAKGLVEVLAERFTAETGAVLAATFGAVGAMRDALLAGAPCDVLVTTESMAASLAASGSLRDEACAVLGRVATGMTVRAGQAAPDVSNADALRTALLAAGAVYHPDALRSTAGIHFAGVLRQLGIAEALAARLQPFPNGATAMLALAASTSPRAIGCTQVSEIMYTPGVALVGVLPAPFELATSYAAAATTHATEPDLAQRFVALLTGAATLALRQASGFEC